MPGPIFRRDSSSKSLQDTVLDTIFVVFVLCTLILAVAGLHCILRRRNRQRSRSWTSCRALRIVSPVPTSCLPEDADYAIYEVEPIQNNKILARDINQSMGHDIEKTESTTDKSEVPISAHPVFMCHK
ncbi:hypothetical protein CVT25_013230 [Psilocybe cyanescens]|uniref:Uncharacterized protein n=1 Tax=Psilocybe cyanescens TaxID=93625 RepID=A0A409X0P2_PSICY|nr:hypothetical protein CVT25_013230 [Psilocybe cyanescens]